MSNHNNRRFGGKGYSAALILCAAAVGILGYAYNRGTEIAPVEETTPVLATQAPAGSSGGKSDQSGMVHIPVQTEDFETPTAGRLAVCPPVEGEMITPYAMEVLAYNQTTRDWRVHNGVDYAAEAGSPVMAAADGEVYTVYDDEQMGMTVVIRHENGYITKYASLDAEVLVSPGETVRMGQQIGCVGSTALMESALGDHLHFCVSLENEAVDPAEFLNP